MRIDCHSPMAVSASFFVTDRRVGAWSNLWKTTPPITTSDYAFSIIELHLNAKGEGEGRRVVTGEVAVDTQAKTIALDAYSTVPV